MTDRFVNRTRELHQLDTWWSEGPGGRLGVVWGRRRIGKTALLQQVARERRAVFHTGAGRPAVDELRLLTRACSEVLTGSVRDFESRPFVDWDDAFDALATAASEEPLLVVLDEFPELVATSPELPGVLRAFWDRARDRSKLRVLVAGSATHVMLQMQEERAPLFGRFDLRLPLHGFEPSEASLMLTDLDPSTRALVYGICGGVPMYLQAWNQHQSVRENIGRLFAEPGSFLLTEGALVVATEGDTGDLGRQVLYAVANGRTKHNEIADAVRADPTRTLERLVDLRLIERMTPVTEDPRRTRRRRYRIADNFLGFWLGVIDRYRSEIDRGLGRSALTSIVAELDDHMGPVWEEAVRAHLRRLAAEGAFPDAVAVGRFWNEGANGVEIDAVVLAGRSREAITIGEVKWAKRVRGDRVTADLHRKALALPHRRDPIQLVVAARQEVTGTLPEDTLVITAADVFAG
jgi:AAA+ ATPase superfamily predicted ATPase